jgi:hypothetical protein
MITLTGFLLGQPGNLRRGGHCYFELGKPFQASPRTVPGEKQAMSEPRQ